MQNRAKTKPNAAKKTPQKPDKLFDNFQKNSVCESIMHYQSLFNAMTESFSLRELVFGRGGKIIDYRFLEVNPSFEKFIGLPRAALIGKLRSQVPVTANPESLKTYAEVALTGKPARFESYNKSLNKFFSVYAYRPAKNQFATIFTDITEQKVAEEQRQLARNELKKHAERLEKAVRDLENLHRAVENASDIIFIADPQGTVSSINKAAENHLGYSPNEIIGKNIAVLENRTGRNFYDTIFKSIKTETNVFRGEIANRHKNGHKRIFEIHVSPIFGKDGKALSFIGIQRDRTEAREIDRAKTEFISMAAHQLRTPLATISMASEMIANGNIGQVDPVAKEQIEEIYATADKMAGLIELFLNISRIELGRLEINPEPTDMAKFAQDLVKDILPQASLKRIKISADFGHKIPPISVDRRIMHIVLENLLTNAVKYTAEGGKIAFRMITEDGSLVYSVADNGRGIPKHQMSLIFSKMFRGDNVRDVGGMGLGLNMSKGMVEQSGGKLWVESEENKGTTFFVSVPLCGMIKKRIKMEP